MADLKPCPFCGSDQVKPDSTCPEDHFVYCLNCECEGPLHITPEPAIEAWNRRANPAPVQAEQSLEVVAEVTRNHTGHVFILGGDGNCFDVSKFVGVKFADHAKATATLAQKDAEIADLEIACEQSIRLEREQRALVRELRAQLEKYKKDAERYRWLKTHAHRIDWFPEDADGRRTHNRPELDAEIDAAMGKNGTEQK